MTGKVVTRFAPSPTGFLHIGGARTALFSWAYARKHGGEFLLRIEDTDRARSTQDAIDAILDGMSWLGLDWDGEPLFQFARADRHIEIAQQLLSQGNAYRCYCTQQELETMRENARKEGRPPIYDGTWRDRDPSEAPEGAPFAVRFKAPKEGETVVDDQVQGRVVFQNKDLDDLIILRSDGTPTYNLSVVVDDHDMGITHVIRGDDHLTNSGRQSQIYAALGWDAPVFAHVPMILGPDGAKLSKRHGALGVEAYREMGYTPEAMRNYLARLGWSHGDDEIFPTEQMVEWFNMEALGKSPSRFDFVKLENLNGHYIRDMSDDALLKAVRAFLPYLPEDKRPAKPLSDADWNKMALALPSLKERAKTLVQLWESAQFLFAKLPLTFTDKATKLLTPEARSRLFGFIIALGEVEDWSVASLDAAARAFVQAEGVKLGDLAQPLRAALTGSTVSPGIFDVMFALGREETLERLLDQTKLST
ncbi:MAG: glutamate--tRNA ligase [Alphaproteobacteria bacterium]